LLAGGCISREFLLLIRSGTEIPALFFFAVKPNGIGAHFQSRFVRAATTGSADAALDHDASGG
jgi:hypothetical protein